MKTEIKAGQKITFEYLGTIYTKKVQSVYIQSWNGVISYNVNKIGSGTGYTSVEHEEVISVK